MRHSVIILSLLYSSFCFSQEYIFTDVNDLINPSLLDPALYSTDTQRVKSVSFALLKFGEEPIIKYNSDESRVSSFGNSANVNFSLYHKRIQFKAGFYYNYFLTDATKNSATKKTSRDTFNLSYYPSKIYEPRFAFDYYPKLFGESYLSDQLRLQVLYHSTHKSNVKSKATTLPYNAIGGISLLDSIYKVSSVDHFINVQYGGFITNPLSEVKVTRTVMLLNTSYNFSSYNNKDDPNEIDSSKFKYGMSGYFALYDFKPISYIRTIYLQAQYSRSIQNHISHPELLSFGLIAECQYGLNSDNTFFVFGIYNHTYNFKKGTAFIGNVLQAGVYFDIPGWNHMFIKEMAE